MMIGLAPNRVRGRVVGWALRVDPRHVHARRAHARPAATTPPASCAATGSGARRSHRPRSAASSTSRSRPNGLALARMPAPGSTAREHADRPKPLFLWMHVLEPHGWQRGRRRAAQRRGAQRIYDRSLAAADALPRRAARRVSHAPARQAPIVIVTADHGEALGDHGQPYHSTDLYDSQIQVPLVIAGPASSPARIPETVSLTDLRADRPRPRRLRAADRPRRSTARSFADLATGKRNANPEAGTAFAAMIKDRSNPGGVTAVIQRPLQADRQWHRRSSSTTSTPISTSARTCSPCSRSPPRT